MASVSSDVDPDPPGSGSGRQKTRVKDLFKLIFFKIYVFKINTTVRKATENIQKKIIPVCFQTLIFQADFIIPGSG